MIDVGTPLPQAPWGFSLGLYFTLIGIASGVTLLTLWLRPGQAEDADRLERFGVWASLATLGIASIILVIDLERPLRFFLVLTEFSTLQSPMAVGAKLIGLKLGLLGLSLYLLERRRAAIAKGDLGLAEGWTERIYRLVPALLAAVSLVLSVYPAALLARTWMSPLAQAPGAQMLFLSTALLLGVACTALYCTRRAGGASPEVRDQIDRLLLILVASQLFLLAFQALTLPRELAVAYQTLLSGGASFMFWGLAVGLGLLVPLLGLLFLPRRSWVTQASAVAILLGASATRFLIFGLN